MQVVNFIYKYIRDSNCFSIYSFLPSPSWKRAIRFSLYFAHIYITRQPGHMTGWLTDWLTDYVSTLMAHRKLFQCMTDGVNRPSASESRPTSQLTMPINFVQFQFVKIKFWSLLANIVKLIIANKKHNVIISNVTFQLISKKEKNIEVKVMCFGDTLTRKYGISFVRHFCPSSQESKNFTVVIRLSSFATSCQK